MQDLLTAIERDGGFTYSVWADALIHIGETTGYAIAVPGTEILLGPADLTRAEFADRFAAVLRRTMQSDDTPFPAYVGGWLSPERGYMLELSEIRQVTRAQAVTLGTERGQEAILDLATGEMINCGGHGDG